MEKRYELLLALAEDASEANQKELVEQVKTIIEKNKGKINSTDDWGKRTLAYVVKHSKAGFYVLINFSGESKLPKILTDILRIEDKVLRFLISEEIAQPKKTEKKKPAAAKVRKLDELVVR